MSDKPAVFARRSASPERISLRFQFSMWGGGKSVRMNCGIDLTADEARALASSLNELAADAKAKTAAKEAAEERRRKWREREVAAGRMKIMSAQEFFRGR